MPPIRSISCDKNSLEFTDSKGNTHTFDITKVVSSDKSSIAKLENYINTQWLPPLINGAYIMEVHIFNLQPLHLTVFCANAGENIPQDWWII